MLRMYDRRRREQAELDVLATLRGFRYAADDGDGAGAGAGSTGDGKGADDGDGDDDPPGEGDGDPAGKTGKTFTNAEVEEIVKARLEREKARQAKDAEAAKEAAEREKLRASAEFEKLATDLEAKVKALEPALEAAEAQVAERDALLARYGEAVGKLVAERTGNLPAPVVALLDSMESLDRLEWITTNAEALGAAGTPIVTIPTTPKPKGNGGNDKKGEAARAAMARRSRKF